MITLLLLLIIFVAVVILGSIITVIWPIAGLLVACLLIDVIFLKKIFGKKKKDE